MTPPSWTGNHYFRAEAIVSYYFVPGESHNTCPWQGQASDYSLSVDGENNPDATWFYSNPKEGVSDIRNRVAFYFSIWRLGACCRR